MQRLQLVIWSEEEDLPFEDLHSLGVQVTALNGMAFEVQEVDE